MEYIASISKGKGMINERKGEREGGNKNLPLFMMGNRDFWFFVMF